MLARPPRLPGFLLGPRLGGGPISDVFSATHRVDTRSYAVKVLKTDAANDATNLQLLRREARIGLAIRHAHLVKIVRANTDGSLPPHTVMERIPGLSVRQLLKRRDWLGPRLAGSIARQVASALHALHIAGFIHGDVKPDNIHFGPGRKATLLDLGFAHRPNENAALIGDGYVLGTANYVAPELLNQSGDGPAADIFSLGVSLFELLTGVLPYESGDVDRTLESHRDSKADSLWHWRGRWPIGIADLVDRMLSRNPRFRPTAAGVVNELGGLIRRAA